MQAKNKEFLKLLHAVRIKRKLSQLEMARLLNMSRPHYCDIENGKRPISKNLIMQVNLLNTDTPSSTLLYLDKIPEETEVFRRTTGIKSILENIKKTPVISWIKTKNILGPQDIPKTTDFYEYIVCPDTDTLGVVIDDNSMSPEYHTGQIAILMANIPPKNKCLVIANHKIKGLLFRRYHILKNQPDMCSLISNNNKAHPAFTDKLTEYHWIWPIYSVVDSVWDNVK